MRVRRWALAVGTATAVLTASLPAPQALARTAEASGPVAVPAPAADVTSAVERRRVDSVPTPKLRWFSCYGAYECATVRLPLDYDDPKGATTEIGLLRVKARKPRERIGSLFVNPGGPGGSATGMAGAADSIFGGAVLDRFDIVGIDPRGVSASTQVRCFKTFREQQLAQAGMGVAFPYTKAEEKAYVASAKAVGKACSTTGRPLTGAMSTAEVARDMDVLRRAVGDKKLTFLGFSYGTALGQYYANMFPDRVRAIAVDGVINPVSWVGTAATGGRILDDRLRSADGAYRALHEILVRCGRVTVAVCKFAGGDPVAKFATLAARLRVRPVTADVDGDGRPEKITYADFVGNLLSLLYQAGSAEFIMEVSAILYDVSAPAGTVAAARLAAQRRALVPLVRRMRALGRDFPYQNESDAFNGVTCVDGLHPKDAGNWPAMTARSDQRAPYFGRAWAWQTASCAGNTWTVRDEDAYRGPFNRRTSAPVLVVGDYYDPATNYEEAVSSSRLLPNSRLLSSDSWGHTAFGSSGCVTDAVEAYLLRGALPAEGTVCVGDYQPFATSAAAHAAAAGPLQAMLTPRIPSTLLGTR